MSQAAAAADCVHLSKGQGSRKIRAGASKDTRLLGALGLIFHFEEIFVGTAVQVLRICSSENAYVLCCVQLQSILSQTQPYITCVRLRT